MRHVYKALFLGTMISLETSNLLVGFVSVNCKPLGQGTIQIAHVSGFRMETQIINSNNQQYIYYIYIYI